MPETSRDLVVVMTRGTDHELSSVGFTIANGGITSGLKVYAFLTSSAVDLVRTHPLVARVEPIEARRVADVAALATRLSKTRFERVISLDDEEPLCKLAAEVPAARLSGAFLAEDGRRA